MAEVIRRRKRTNFLKGPDRPPLATLCLRLATSLQQEAGAPQLLSPGNWWLGPHKQKKGAGISGGGPGSGTVVDVPDNPNLGILCINAYAGRGTSTKKGSTEGKLPITKCILVVKRSVVEAAGTLDNDPRQALGQLGLLQWLEQNSATERQDPRYAQRWSKLWTDNLGSVALAGATGQELPGQTGLACASNRRGRRQPAALSAQPIISKNPRRHHVNPAASSLTFEAVGGTSERNREWQFCGTMAALFVYEACSELPPSVETAAAAAAAPPVAATALLPTAPSSQPASLQPGALGALLLLTNELPSQAHLQPAAPGTAVLDQLGAALPAHDATATPTLLQLRGIGDHVPGALFTADACANTTQPDNGTSYRRLQPSHSLSKLDSSLVRILCSSGGSMDITLDDTSPIHEATSKLQPEQPALKQQLVTPVVSGASIKAVSAVAAAGGDVPAHFCSPASPPSLETAAAAPPATATALLPTAPSTQLAPQLQPLQPAPTQQLVTPVVAGASVMAGSAAAPAGGNVPQLEELLARLTVTPASPPKVDPGTWASCLHDLFYDMLMGRYGTKATGGWQGLLQRCTGQPVGTGGVAQAGSVICLWDPSCIEKLRRNRKLKGRTLISFLCDNWPSNELAWPAPGSDERPIIHDLAHVSLDDRADQVESIVCAARRQGATDQSIALMMSASKDGLRTAVYIKAVRLVRVLLHHMTGLPPEDKLCLSSGDNPQSTFWCVFHTACEKQRDGIPDEERQRQAEILDMLLDFWIAELERPAGMTPPAARDQLGRLLSHVVHTGVNCSNKSRRERFDPQLLVAACEPRGILLTGSCGAQGVADMEMDIGVFLADVSDFVVMKGQEGA